MIDEIETTAFVDSDHAHDKVTSRSIMDLLVLLDRKPVFFMSKRQGAIDTSTYSAEFCAMRTAVEEVQAMSTVLDSLLRKKHVEIAYHKTRET
eukprot:15326421-Ditylum_brightwellii.AAC.1